MNGPAADPSFLDSLYQSGTVTGLLLLGLIVILLVFTAQLEALFSACRQLYAHRQSLANAQRRIGIDIEATRKATVELDEALPELRKAVERLGAEYEVIAAKAAEARKALIREVVVTDIFVAPGDRPFLATVQRPKPDPDEPLADAWRAGRDHVIYAAQKSAAARRFEQRFPAERGFRVGPLIPFEIPWTPIEAPTESVAETK